MLPQRPDHRQSAGARPAGPAAEPEAASGPCRRSKSAVGGADSAGGHAPPPDRRAWRVAATPGRGPRAAGGRRGRARRRRPRRAAARATGVGRFGSGFPLIARASLAPPCRHAPPTRRPRADRRHQDRRGHGQLADNWRTTGANRRRAHGRRRGRAGLARDGPAGGDGRRRRRGPGGPPGGRDDRPRRRGARGVGDRASGRGRRGERRRPHRRAGDGNDAHRPGRGGGARRSLATGLRPDSAVCGDGGGIGAGVGNAPPA